MNVLFRLFFRFKVFFYRDYFVIFHNWNYLELSVISGKIMRHTVLLFYAYFVKTTEDFMLPTVLPFINTLTNLRLDLIDAKKEPCGKNEL